MNLIDDLQFRGLIHQCTDWEGLKAKLDKGNVRLYAGFDPTAGSLHIGHLLPILTLKRFQLAGHTPFALVGGATGLIGDPTGRSAERPVNNKETVEHWTQSIREQLSTFLDFESATHPARVFNNYDWFASVNVVEFLREIGTRFTVNYMLGKETVESRLQHGISFAEMSYMLLQAYDFQFLLREYDCCLQIGGSDQWGNITAGLGLIDKLGGGKRAYGLTMPLIMKSDGTKFGKTAGGAVWLDPKLTSPYEFYQFWIQTDDADVIRFLNYFTFLSHEEIIERERAAAANPEAREAQRMLAFEVTKLVHGEAEAERCRNLSGVLFREEPAALTAEEWERALADIPSATFGSGPVALLDLLIAAKAVPSKRQAREEIRAGAVTINGKRVTDPNFIIGPDERMHGRFALIRRGKRNVWLAAFD